MSRFTIPFAAPLLVLMLFLAGCGTMTSSTPQPLPPIEEPTTQATNTVASLPVEPTETTEAAPTLEATTPIEPTAEIAATESVATPITEATLPAEMDTDYYDDRTNAETLMESFVNALNRKEYLRAYSYWKSDTEGLAPFEEFAAGYAETEAVKLLIGDIGGDAGAGNFYYTVPTTMEVRTTTDENQIFVGCYLLHLSNPRVQGTPPFQPLAIESAYVEEVPQGTDTVATMTTICEAGGYSVTSPLPPASTPEPGDISNQVYIDNRSDPVAVLRSLFNAVNSAQYVRAYSYWEAGAEGLVPFEEFEAGYANTQAVQLETGEVISDAGAGQLFYSVPVTLTAQNRDGTTQIFVGCYVLHLSQPAIQATPPFQPLAIRSATIEEVGTADEAAGMMATVCEV